MHVKLSIHPISATLQRDTKTFGSMNPYCRVIIGSQNKKSRIADGAGKHPKWSDYMDFIKTDEDIITIEVWNYSLAFSDDLIGTASIPLAKIMAQPVSQETIEILHNGKKAGDVRIESRFNYNPNQVAQLTPIQVMSTPVQGYPPTYQGYQQNTYPVHPGPGYGSVSNYTTQPGYTTYQGYPPQSYPLPYPPQQGYPQSTFYMGK